MHVDEGKIAIRDAYLACAKATDLNVLGKPHRNFLTTHFLFA
jgi:hypothetical protein